MAKMVSHSVRSKALAEIEALVSRCPREIPAGVSEAYIGGNQSQLKFQGLKVPTIRRLSRQGFTFSELSLEQQLAIWCHVWTTSKVFEVRSLALLWVHSKNCQPFFVDWWHHLEPWAEVVDNWAHGDDLCGVYARILEQKPRLVLPVLRRWNKSSAPWLNRISLVSLLHYNRQRSRRPPFPIICNLVTSHIKTQHHYVQKSVGWTLRECYGAYPQQTLKYIKSNLGNFSATAFTTMIEKMNETQRASLKAERRRLRQKK